MAELLEAIGGCMGQMPDPYTSVDPGCHTEYHKLLKMQHRGTGLVESV